MSHSSESTLIPPLTQPSSKKKLTPRCCMLDCKKKIGLIRFECKCGLSFCVKHKLPELHNCSFNHKNEGITSLKHKLVKVSSNKIIPI